MKATVNLEDMETLGSWFCCTGWTGREERAFPPMGVGGGMARPRPGAEKHEIGVEDLWMVLLPRATGLGHKGPGLEGKNWIFFSTSNGEPWKTSEQERDKEQQCVVSAGEWDGHRK